MQRAIGVYDKLIIFLCCLILYFIQADFNVNINAILISFIVSCFISYFDNYKIKIFLALVFFILILFEPGFLMFMPLIIFDMVFGKHQYIYLFAIIPIIDYFKMGYITTAIIVIVMLVLSVLISHRVRLIIKMHDRHNELIDTSREMSIKLEKQNSDLIEKQDDELYMAALNERNRIAREIHDNVGHSLTSAILQVGALKVINKDEQVEKSINMLNNTLTNAMDSIRDSVHALYDESINLNAGINELIKEFTFCQVNYTYNISSNLGKKLNYAFIAIIKEALTNIINHSDATEVNIIVTEHPGLYQLIIRDNGNAKGYDLSSGLGLNNMMERVNAFNGNMNIRTKGGFEIFITIPKGSQGK